MKDQEEPDRSEVLRRMRALGLDKLTPRYTMIVPVKKVIERVTTKLVLAFSRKAS